MKYFAYGSNMAPEVMARICENYQVLGPARLDDYRLTFTRRSARTKTGVADVDIAPGLAVWGVLFEIDEECLLKLDLKEGFANAYTRISVGVKLQGETTHRAITYTVIDKEHKEVPPSCGYINGIIQGARSHALPRAYVHFLELLALEDESRFRSGFLAKPTSSRDEARGMPLVRVSGSLHKVFPRKRFCIVAYQGKLCGVKIAYNDRLPADTCEVDQAVRHALGVKGRITFGVFVNLSRSRIRIPSHTLLSPRSLVLPNQRPSVFDSEKNICTLNKDNIRLLGLEERDYVRIYTVVKDRRNRFRLCSLSRRVFAGTPFPSGQELVKGYPRPDEIYLDLDGRLALGIGRDETGVPTLVQPDVRRLFLSRVLYNDIIMLFLGILALTPLLQEIASVLGWSPLLAGLASVVLAVVATLVLTLVDLRARIGY